MFVLGGGDGGSIEGRSFIGEVVVYQGGVCFGGGGGGSFIGEVVVYQGGVCSGEEVGGGSVEAWSFISSLVIP